MERFDDHGLVPNGSKKGAVPWYQVDVPELCPCTGFMERFDHDLVPNGSDTGARYCYRGQPKVCR